MMCLLLPCCFLQKMNLFDDLCDDLLIDILTRLPVRQILRCRAVCTRWRRLILSPTFAQVHLGQNRSSPATFFQIHGRPLDGKLDHYMERLYFVHWEEFESHSFWKKKKKKIQNVAQTLTLTLNPNPNPKSIQTWLPCCCNGLLIFSEVYHPYTHFICNPTTNETAVMGLGFPWFRVCGFYFHLPTNRYRLLCVELKLAGTIGAIYRYYICGLDFVKLRKVGESSYSPGSSMTWLTINGFMYMEMPYESCSRHILRYELKTEQMTFMPHPQIVHLGSTHINMHLIEIESDQLSFGYNNMAQGIIDMWVLEDCANWVWNKKYSVKMLDEMLRFDDRMCSLSVGDQELILWNRNGVFKVDLVLDMTKQLANPRHFWGNSYRPVFVTVGKMSFVSPHHLISYLEAINQNI